MTNQIETIRNRVVGTESKNKVTELTSILSMVREFSCLGEVIGREFEVFDSEDKLVYTIKQNPMSLSQLSTLIKEFINIKKLDNEQESAKMGGKNKGGLRNLRQ